MGCKVAIAQQIWDEQAHYLLGLKRNQSGLVKDMEQLTLDAVARNFACYTVPIDIWLAATGTVAKDGDQPKTVSM
jgi:hypothetical protein